MALSNWRGRFPATRSRIRIPTVQIVSNKFLIADFFGRSANQVISRLKFRNSRYAAYDVVYQLAYHTCVSVAVNLANQRLARSSPSLDSPNKVFPQNPCLPYPNAFGMVF